MLIFVPPSLALNLEVEQMPEQFLEGRLGSARRGGHLEVEQMPEEFLEARQMPEQFLEGRLGLGSARRGGQGSIVNGIDSVIGSVHSRLR